jgi:hypothetical protein
MSPNILTASLRAVVSTVNRINSRSDLRRAVLSSSHKTQAGPEL